MTTAELLLIFAASLTASVHCAVMCGGFALSLARPGQARATFVRVLAYHAGKLFTYVFIGGVAGVVGGALLSNPAIRAAQAAFAALAGVIIVVVGLQTLGLLPGQNIVNRAASWLWLGPFLGPFFKTFRERRSLDGAFFLGLFNGFLPCGLVYTFAIAAAGAGSPGAAVLAMLAFGLGTVPMLAAVGWGGAAVAAKPSLRPLLARLSGVLVVALGTLTVLRGLPLIPTFAAADHTAHSPMMTMDTPVDLEPAPAPPFTLTDQDGQAVSLHDYHGRIVVLDFIYTTCTTVCPRLTATFRDLQDGLGSDFGKKVALVSITIDPATDTPAVLKAFGEEWGAGFDGWAFLTGSASEIESVTAQYAVYVANTDAGLAHTDTILLIDQRGQLRSVFSMQTDPETLIDQIRQLAR
jgi:protein SCO1/2